MADFKIKSDIKLDPSEALAQLADLRKQFEETRARLTQPIPVSLDIADARKALGAVTSTASAMAAAADASEDAAKSVGQTADEASRTASAAKDAAENTEKIGDAAQAAQGSYLQLFVSVSKFITSGAAKLGVGLVKGIASGVRASASLLKSAFSGVLSTVTGLFSGIRSVIGTGISAVRSAMGGNSGVPKDDTRLKRWHGHQQYKA